MNRRDGCMCLRLKIVHGKMTFTENETCNYPWKVTNIIERRELRPGQEFPQSDMANMHKKQIHVYASVHKGIRNLFALVTFQAGNTDWTDSAEVSILHGEWKVALKLLNSHQEYENRIIHPVLDKVSFGSHRGYEAEHHVHWKILNRLDSQFKHLLNDNVSETERSEIGLDFYRQLNMFYADFLKHLNREETEAEQILNSRCLPESLTRMLEQIISSIPQDEMLLYIYCIFPAINLPECMDLMKSIKRAVPKESLSSLEGHVRKIRGESDWKAIKESLEI